MRMARAIDTCHRSVNTPSSSATALWPLDALADLREFAAWAGQGFPAAIGSISRPADYRSVALRRRAVHRLRHGHDRGRSGVREAAPGRRRTLQDRAGSRPASRLPALAPSPGARASGLIATRQGIVTSFADAEWLLVRTAARIDYQAGHAPASPYEPDEDDLLALSRALAGTRGQSPGQIIIQLTPRIEARIAEIGQGPDTAAELGREHGQGNLSTEPYCGLGHRRGCHGAHARARRDRGR